MNFWIHLWVDISWNRSASFSICFFKYCGRHSFMSIWTLCTMKYWFLCTLNRKRCTVQWMFSWFTEWKFWLPQLQCWIWKVRLFLYVLPMLPLLSIPPENNILMVNTYTKSKLLATNASANEWMFGTLIGFRLNHNFMHVCNIRNFPYSKLIFIVVCTQIRANPN